MLFSTYDFHLPKKQLLQDIRWLTPTVTSRETSSEMSATCHAVTAAKLFPPTFPKSDNDTFIQGKDQRAD